MTRWTIVFAILLAGCGYTQSSSDASLYRKDVHTVAVPIFTNKTFFRGVEFNLTDAIVKDIEVHTPYKVVDRDRADTILEGEITGVKTQTISLDRNTALPQEQLQTITVNFVWKDLHTGKIYRQRVGYEETKPFYPTLGEGQFVGTQSAAEDLAISIVQDMQADW